MKFNIPVLDEAYNKAKGKIFTWSPENQLFKDQSGGTDYSYWAMLWLKDHNYLQQMPFDGESIVYKYQIRR